MVRQRSPRQRDEKHLAFVRAQPCCVCPAGCNRQAEAAHIRMGNSARGKPPTGMQEKPDDKWTVPLCDYHHRTGVLAQHKMSEQEFWFEIHGRNPFDIAERLWIESGGAERALQPAKTKRVKRTALRKAKDQRKKIVGRSEWLPGRKLQSRNSFDRRP